MANELIEKQQEDKFEPVARILAANAVAQSLSFTMERKYLESIDSSKDPPYSGNSGAFLPAK